MRKLFPVLIILTLLLSCSPTRQLQREIGRQISSEAFEKSFTGFMVYDPAEQKVLYDQNSGKYFTPASNMKLFTYYAGLKFLEDSIPALHYSITNDSLIFWGTGDPSFLYPGLPKSNVLNFLKSRKEKLFYLSPTFSEKALGPGWSWDDYNSYYSAEKSAFPIYGNLVVFKNSSEGKFPKAHPGYFGNKLELVENESEQVIRDPDSNVFRFSPNFRKRTTEQIIPFKYSEEIFVQLLKDTLGKPLELLPSKPINLSKSQTLYSIPADSLYKQMLQESDNFVAEQLLMIVAGKISDSLQSKTAISQTLEQLKEIPDKPNWVDGSGLSRYNLVTPRSLVFLLEKIAREVPQQNLFSLFPAGGKNGTLQNSFLSTEPFVFAKTGTLRNNYSLSGYLITRKGKVLIFSFMNNNYPGSSATIRMEMEKILRNIHNRY